MFSPRGFINTEIIRALRSVTKMSFKVIDIMLCGCPRGAQTQTGFSRFLQQRFMENKLFFSFSASAEGRITKTGWIPAVPEGKTLLRKECRQLSGHAVEVFA